MTDSHSQSDLLVSRRSVLRASLGLAGLTLAPQLAWADEPTPAQTSGPFHPLRRERDDQGQPVLVDRRLLQYLDQDSDLTFVQDSPGVAQGQLIYVNGRVEDTQGQVIEGAVVEIWQACSSGRYNHSADPSDEFLDPNFQYWGQATTDEEGRYLFRTILPGAYRASPNWVRPPHIHFRVSRRGYVEVTSQLYFEDIGFYYGNRMWPPETLLALNQADAILDGVSPHLRPQVTCPARAPLPQETQLEAESRVCPFTIVLEEAQLQTAQRLDPALRQLHALA